MPDNSARLVRPSVRVPRRALLLGGLALAVSGITGLHAAPPDGFTHFMAVSQALTARTDLDPAIGRALFEALCRSDANFPAALSAFPAREDAAASDLPTSKAILNGWYCGIVGSGAHATCVIYVAALMNAVVADVLTPPTYAFGPYGSWAARPVAAG